MERSIQDWGKDACYHSPVITPWCAGTAGTRSCLTLRVVQLIDVSLNMAFSFSHTGSSCDNATQLKALCFLTSIQLCVSFDTVACLQQHSGHAGSAFRYLLSNNSKQTLTAKPVYCVRNWSSKKLCLNFVWHFLAHSNMLTSWQLSGSRTRADLSNPTRGMGVSVSLFPAWTDTSQSTGPHHPNTRNSDICSRLHWNVDRSVINCFCRRG
jgi:hypothetical protein